MLENGNCLTGISKNFPRIRDVFVVSAISPLTNIFTPRPPCNALWITASKTINFPAGDRRRSCRCLQASLGTGLQGHYRLYHRLARRGGFLETKATSDKDAPAAAPATPAVQRKPCFMAKTCPRNSFRSEQQKTRPRALQGHLLDRHPTEQKTL